MTTLQFLPYAGFILLLVLLALISGQLYHLHAKVKPIMVLDKLDALLTDLESLDFVGFITKIQTDATAAETAVEGKVEELYNRLEAIVAQVKATINPPAPEPAPAEQPAA